MRDRLLVPLGALLLLVLVPEATRAVGPEDDARLVGYWRVTWEDGESQREYFFDFHQSGEKITGSFISPRSGGYPVKTASVTGEKVRIVVVRMRGGIPVALNIDGAFEGRRTIHADVSALGSKVGELSMTRLPDPVGEWAVKSVTPNGGVRESTLKLARGEGVYTGTFVQSGRSTEAKSVRWQEDRLAIEVSLPAGDRQITFAIDAGFSDRNSLEGHWSVGSRSGEWSASRKDAKPLHNPAGRWAAVSKAKSGASSKESVLEIAADGSGYRATYSGERGKTVYRRVTCDGEELELELEVKVEGTPVTYVVRAAFEDANTLKGRWHVKDFRQYAGEWTATRAK